MDLFWRMAQTLPWSREVTKRTLPRHLNFFFQRNHLDLIRASAAEQQQQPQPPPASPFPSVSAECVLRGKVEPATTPVLGPVAGDSVTAAAAAAAASVSVSPPVGSPVPPPLPAAAATTTTSASTTTATTSNTATTPATTPAAANVTDSTGPASDSSAAEATTADPPRIPSKLPGRLIPGKVTTVQPVVGSMPPVQSFKISGTSLKRSRAEEPVDLGDLTPYLPPVLPATSTPRSGMCDAVGGSAYCVVGGLLMM